MLQIRFTQKNFKLLCAVEKFILNISNNPPDNPNEQIEAIMDFFKSVINTCQMGIK